MVGKLFNQIVYVFSSILCLLCHWFVYFIVFLWHPFFARRNCLQIWCNIQNKYCKWNATNFLMDFKMIIQKLFAFVIYLTSCVPILWYNIQNAHVSGKWLTWNAVYLWYNTICKCTWIKDAATHEKPFRNRTRVYRLKLEAKIIKSKRNDLNRRKWNLFLHAIKKMFQSISYILFFVKQQPKTTQNGWILGWAKKIFLCLMGNQNEKKS